MRNNFKNIKQIVLRNRRYRIRLATRMGSDDDPVHGDCSNPDSPGRVIRYYVGLRGEIRLDVFVHEMLHACFWDVAEESIQEAGHDIARVLWRCGYRDDVKDIKTINYPKFITIRHRKYSFSKESGLTQGRMGEVSAPWIKNKYVKLRISLKGEKELIGLLRCLIIASFWDFDEEVSRQSANDIGHALWRMGYRKIK